MDFKRFNGSTWETVQHKVYGSGTDSLTAFPAVIQASGDPLTDYTVSGNTVQDGTPTPEAPVDVVGCGEGSVNIMPSSIAKTITENGVTMTCDGLGRYEVSGTAGNGGSVLTLTLTSEFTIPVSVGKGGQGCMLLWNNIAVSASLATLYFMYKGSAIESWSLSIQNRQHNAYTSMGGKKCDAIRIEISGGKSAYFTFSPEFVETGSYPQEYEPYGYKLTPTVNGTEHPIYLGQVKATRKIYKMRLLDPLSSTATANGYRLSFSISDHRAPSHQSGGGMCTITTWNSNYNQAGFAAAGQYAYITQNISEWATIEGATQWFKENEVYIWYSLANPETGIINEPLHKIGDYADTITMAQAGVTIPTSDGDNTITFGTSVQPSGMSATFKGWHPVRGAKQYDGNDWR